MTLQLTMFACAVIATLVAAITDARTGLIPNKLTVPLLVAGLAGNGVVAGWTGLGHSVIGLVACGAVPYVLFRKGAAGGGDVKLYAAIGALCGVFLGLEAQMLSYCAAAAFAMAQLAWRGQLSRLLVNAAFLVFNPLLPRARRRIMQPEAMTTLRLGPFIFVGTLVAVALRTPVFLP